MKLQLTSKELRKLGLRIPGVMQGETKKPSKYHNKKTDLGFDSKKEEKRWHELCLLQRAGKISDLEKQKRFDIIVNGKKICFYKADFVYFENGKQVVEDVKSWITKRNSTYVLKRKLMAATRGILIRET